MQGVRNVISRREPWECMNNAAKQYDSTQEYGQHDLIQIGRMNTICQYCAALKWKSETPGLCCSAGKVILPPLIAPPEPLMSLLNGQRPHSKHFLKNIRRYNSCFQMTSFGAKNIQEGGFMPTFKIQGQVCHRIGSLLPLANEESKYMQIYFMGDENLQVRQRRSIAPGTKTEIVLGLQQMLHQHNAYVTIFKNDMDRCRLLPSDEYRVVIKADKRPTGEHERRFNAPTINEVAVLMVGEYANRDIILQTQNNQLQRVSETHRSYDAMQYPLIFWQGEDGYHFMIFKIDPSNGVVLTKKVSSMDFYAYRIMLRRNQSNHLLMYGNLFHQYLVDMYAKIETERLLFIRLNQKKLRAENYINLRDAVINDGNTSNVGQMVILPSTFTGSPRHMHEYTQDSMTYVRKFGRPDLFITFTCNPKWEEITIELLPGQSVTDRHDLVARVFHQKVIKFMDVLTKGKVFGEVQCYMYTIEWQKRGLPHMHLLLWLKQKLQANDIDSVISAEIPNVHEDPILFEIVTKT